ncbi:hypothetical protein [Desulfobacter postgatei]|uniref:hypothetical protein n=1 Tax=Desulfobacter postgatei TaxID=2293 RepID=UPI00259BB1C8|nr:hypothetical protein [uncultured Desulfobacter sp.]
MSAYFLNHHPKIIETLSEDNLEKFILEQELFKERAHRQAQENLLLKEDLSKRKKELKASEQLQQKLISEVINSKKELLKNKERAFDSLIVKKKTLDTEIDRVVGYVRKLFLITILIYYVVLYILIGKLGWEKLEQWTWILTTIPIVVSVVYFLITGHTINPKIFFENKKKEITAKKYELAFFDDDQLNEQKKAIEELKSEIQYIELPTIVVEQEIGLEEF